MRISRFRQQITRLCFVFALLLCMGFLDSRPAAGAKIAMESLQVDLEPNIVTNGSFETPTVVRSIGFDEYGAGQSLGGWTIESGEVDHVSQSYWQASEGLQSVDVTGSPGNGTMYQDLPTAPQQAYQLSFDLSGNPIGAPAIKQIEVWWGTTLLDTVSYDTTGNSNRNMNWNSRTYAVTATTTTTRLGFKSLTSGYYGPVIDNVRVQGYSHPSGFNQILNDTGVALYKKDYSNGQADFVQVVSLNQAASVILMHGAIADAGTGQGSYGGASPYFYRSSLDDAWNSFSAAESRAFCITNGGFFADRHSDGTLINPTNLSFPLKKDGTIVSDGSRSTIEFPGQLLMLEIWNDHFDIRALSRDALYSSSAPDILGGLSENADKGINVPTERTFAGVDDLNGDGNFETILFFNSHSSTQVAASQVLRDFGADKVIMFDGGASTQLNCRNNKHIASSRSIPQTIGVVSGVPGNDEFNNPTLDLHWQWYNTNPNGWSLTNSPGNLQIIATRGDLRGSCNNAQNLLLQDAPAGDFEISTKLSFYPTVNYQQGGLLIFTDNNNYIKLGALWNNSVLGGQNVEFLQEQDGVFPSGWPRFGINLSTPAFLKISKSGNVYTGLYSADGQLWRIVGSITAAPTIVNPRIGLYAFNGANCFISSSLDIAVNFDFFRVTTEGNRADVDVWIGSNHQGRLEIPMNGEARVSFSGVNNGPVKVIGTNGKKFVASERVAYSPNGGANWTSYSELMGLPFNQLTNSYVFPWYNNVDLNSQLRFGNVGTTPTTVTVTIGGQVMGNYNLAPNASMRISYGGLDKGPVKVTSFGGVPIIASLRVAYNNGTAWTSFSEMMGLPSNRLTNSYVFPWYNNLDLNSQLRFGNVGTANTTVTVTIGGVVRGTYNLAPNTSQRVSYDGLDKGPVRITSSGNVPIIASMRVAYHNGTAWTDFSEMMGLPTISLSTHYSFPVYDNVLHNSQLRFGNVGNSNTTVTVTINGVLKGSYNLSVNQSQRVSYVGLNSGPVVIQSSGNVPIIASERVAYFNGSAWSSFAEMMGLPQSQLSTTFLFPWYNNLDLDTQLRVGVP